MYINNICIAGHYHTLLYNMEIYGVTAKEAEDFSAVLPGLSDSSCWSLARAALEIAIATARVVRPHLLKRFQ